MKTRKNKKNKNEKNTNNNIIECNNPTLLENFNKYKGKIVEKMFHITTKENAEKILKEGFDPTRSRTKAFGEGVNFSNNLEELSTYQTKKVNCIIVSLVKYNKKKLNTSDIYNPVIGKNEFGKFGYSKPKYMHPPKGYDALYSGDYIYVIPNKDQIYPMYAYCV